MEEIGNNNLNFRAFDMYSARIPPQEEEILDASLPNAYFNDIDFARVSIAPMIDVDTGRIIGIPIYVHFFHGPEIELLCSDLLMEQFMQSNGIQDVTNIKIFSMVDFIDGFFARI
ncbi:MAG: hypothetical protein LBH86_02105, partial [Oscillospiraceae bacterium]|nr:hypothetical protein [Oscillospiraceae bacterium]